MQLKKTPKVSIITVCYNARSIVEETILSVVSQSYSDTEYIIIDGGSSDGTVEVIKKYLNNISLFISEPDKGIYDAMNKGLKAATGEWINFMNAGDKFSSNDVLAEVFEKRSYDSEVKVIYGDVFLKLSDNLTIKQLSSSLKFIERAMPFCHQSTFVSKSAIKYFNTRYKICADYDFFYNLYFADRKSFYYVNCAIAIYDNTHGVSVDNQRENRKENLVIRSAHKNPRWYWDALKYFVKFSVLRIG